MDGSVVCWGRRDRLGAALSNAAPQHAFVSVQGIDDAIDVAAGASHTCARRADGSLWCWGDNARGQTGTNPSATPQALTPIQVTLP